MMPAARSLFMLAVVPLAQTPVEPGSSDDFNLFLLLLLLGFLAVCLIGIGVGIVLALAGTACASVLIALGIVSTSAAVALWRRQVAAGVRAFHYQVCATLAAPAGIGGLWVAAALSGQEMRLRWLVPAGLTTGILAGLMLAAISDWAVRAAHRRLIQPRS